MLAQNNGIKTATMEIESMMHFSVNTFLFCRANARQKDLTSKCATLLRKIVNGLHMTFESAPFCLAHSESDLRIGDAILTWFLTVEFLPVKVCVPVDRSNVSHVGCLEGGELLA